MATLEITFSGTNFATVWENVIHATTTLSTTSAVADVMDTQWVDRLRPFQHDQCRWLSIKVRDVSSPPTLVTFTKPINKLGNGVGAAFSDQVLLAMCIQKKTAVPGRHGIGRFFLAGMSVGSQNLGILTNAHITAMQSMFTTMLSHIGVGGDTGVQIGLCQRGNETASYKSITALAVRPILATVRRRQYGVGI